MSVNIIKYNGIEIGSPTPFVTLERSHVFNGQKLGNVDKIKLIGQLTGRYSDLTGYQQDLINKFNQDFKTFEIFEENAIKVIYTGTNNFGQITGATIRDVDSAVPFPLEFDVNLNFNPKDVKLKLINLNHSYFTDIKMALVSPNDFSAFIPFNTHPDDDSDLQRLINYDFIFSKDSNNTFWDNTSPSGTYKTTATGTNLYDAELGAPFPITLPNNKSLSMDIFSNQNANGKWKLYIFDAVGGDAGIIDQAQLIFSTNQETIYQKSGVIVNSINFSEGVYNGILKYEVDLVAKDFNYNVQNPVNQFTINKQNNTLTLNHNVSAQGVNTSSTSYSNSLDNAISFVNQFTGLNGIPNLYIEDNIGTPESITVLNAPDPDYNGIYHKYVPEGRVLWANESNNNYIIESPSHFSDFHWNFYNSQEGTISTNFDSNPYKIPILNWNPSFDIKINSGNFILLEQKESINRIDGTYSIQEIYTKDLHGDHPNYGILKYITEYNSGAEQDVVNFSIKGQYSDSAINGDFEELKTSFNSDIKPTLLSKLSGNMDSFYNGYINPTPLSYSINENSGSHSIDFQFEYDNLNLPNPYISYTSNISRDEISQIISINLNADIMVRGGSLANRYAIAQSTYPDAVNALSDIAGYLYSGFIEFNGYNFSYPLRRLKLDTKDNKSLGKISLSATFDDKETPYNAAEADYSVNKQLPVWYFSQNATLQKNNYIFQDFDIYTPLRSSYDINVKTKQATNVTPEAIGNELVNPQEGEIKNKKFDYQKEKDGRIRSIKTSIEVISKDSSAAFPKDVIQS